MSSSLFLPLCFLWCSSLVGWLFFMFIKTRFRKMWDYYFQISWFDVVKCVCVCFIHNEYYLRIEIKHSKFKIDFLVALCVYVCLSAIGSLSDSCCCCCSCLFLVDLNFIRTSAHIKQLAFISHSVVGRNTNLKNDASSGVRICLKAPRNIVN